MPESKKVGAFEAKTKLSELTRMTEQGASFVICRRGKEVARLIPPSRDDQKRDFRRLRDDFRKLRTEIGQRIGGKINIRELIKEGRRF